MTNATLTEITLWCNSTSCFLRSVNFDTKLISERVGSIKLLARKMDTKELLRCPECDDLLCTRQIVW